MITFNWIRRGTYQVLKDGKEVGTFTPSTKEQTKISFNSDFTCDREEKIKIVDLFFVNYATA